MAQTYTLSIIIDWQRDLGDYTSITIEWQHDWEDYFGIIIEQWRNLTRSVLSLTDNAI